MKRPTYESEVTLAWFDRFFRRRQCSPAAPSRPASIKRPAIFSLVAEDPDASVEEIEAWLAQPDDVKGQQFSDYIDAVAKLDKPAFKS